MVVGSIAVMLHVAAARAQQHASDNPVTAAQDAFGLTLGLESIGLYGPGRNPRLQPAVGRQRTDRWPVFR